MNCWLNKKEKNLKLRIKKIFKKYNKLNEERRGKK